MKNKYYVCLLAVLLTACQKKPEENHKDAHTKITNAAEIKSNDGVLKEELIIPSNHVQGTEKSAYPDVLIQYIQVRQAGCKQHLQHKIQDLVTEIDLFGDASPEYLIEPNEIHCETYASTRGNGGRDIAVFAKLKDGTAKQVFDHAMFNYEIKPSAAKSELWLEVGGGYCGQDMSQISRSEAINCKRLVVWDAKSQQLVLGQMIIEEPVLDSSQMVEEEHMAD